MSVWYSSAIRVNLCPSVVQPSVTLSPVAMPETSPATDSSQVVDRFPDPPTKDPADRDIVPLRQRLFHAAVSALAIAALGWWSWYSDPDPSLSDVMARPASFEGQEIKIGDEPILESVNSDFFVVRSLGCRLRVAGTVSPDDIGQFIYVRGVFRQPTPGAGCDGVISPAEHHVARGRHAKIWLSVIPVLWVGALLLRHFRINASRMCIEERSCTTSPSSSPPAHA